MNIIAENKQIHNFQMAFKLSNGADGSEFLDYDLPFPNTVQHLNGFVRIMWLINGYTGTKKSREYFNDIIARFIISYSEYEAQRIPYKLSEIQNDTLHELKEFKALESIKRRAINITKADSVVYSRDAVFYAIKFYAEHLILERGICQYELMEDFALSNFLDRKDKSTLKAKCRSIFYWYEERDFKLSTRTFKQTREEYKMTRQENMLKINEDRATTNKRLVVNATSGLMSELYKKPNGKWHITKLAKDLKLSRDTVMKYLS